MNFLKKAELQNLNLETIDENILLLSSQLIQLKIKKATRQAFKPHEFKHIKRELAQLFTWKNNKNNR
jgi:large subunit ribosomal protein L29